MSLCTGLIFLGALAWIRTHRLSSDLWSDYLIAFCFALWLYALLLGSRDDASRAYVYWARKLAGFSYTLYLVHLPALILLRGLLDPRGDWEPDMLHLIYALGIGLLTLTYSYLVAEVTEAHRASVRSSLLRMIAQLKSQIRL